jgi:hypothetical protein
MKIPDWDGDPLAANSFWECWDASVETLKKMSNVHKLILLRSVCKGKAFQAIEKYPVTHANYPLAIKVLKNRFCKPDRVRLALRTELMRLPTSSERICDVRDSWETVQRIAYQLEALGATISEDTLLVIQTKLPKSILEKLFEKKARTDEWTFDVLAEHVESILQHKEDVDCAVRECHESARRNNTVDDKKSASKFPRYGDREPKLVAMAVNKSERNTWPCVFCNNEQHRSSSCSQYSTIDARKTRLRELNLCYHCFRTVHFGQPCEREKKCWKCKGPHNTALCSERGDKKEKKSRPGTSNRTPPMKMGKAYKTGVHVIQKDTSTTHNEDSVVNASIIEAEAAIMANANEKPDALLMSIEATVLSDNAEANALLFLDSGSQASFMTIEKAKDKPLNL